MDIKKRRRQVAWICFEPYLAEEQRLQAIQILEHSFQIDGAVNLMAYVAKICMKLGIDLQNHNMLYNKFHKLMSEPTELSVMDPLLLIYKKDQESSTFEKNSAVKLVELDEKPFFTQQQKPAYSLVFATFMAFVLEYTPNTIELFSILTELVADKKLKSQDLENYISEWIKTPTNFSWSDELNQQTLTRLVHLVYMGLCEILGPVATDDCFHKALVMCEQKPEARLFPPSQFL